MQQGEPQTTVKPAHNHRIWGTPQMGKMFISDGIFLPHTYRCGKYKWTNTSTLYLTVSQQETKQTSILKIVNYINEVGIYAIKSSEIRDE